MTSQTGLIKAIAWRPTDGDTMCESDHCKVRRNTGIDKENRKPGKRTITLLSYEQWRTVCDQLHTDLPWITRRANLLLEGIDLQQTIDKPIQIGEVRVWIHGETKPCKLMDEQHAGLREALKPDGRGGVFGQVLNDGTITIGDSVVIDQSHLER